MSIVLWTNRLIQKLRIQGTFTTIFMQGSSACRFAIDRRNPSTSPMVTLFDRKHNGPITYISLFKYTSITQVDTSEIDQITYEKVCEETLNSLSEYFEELIENDNKFTSADVSYSDGVLTINFGDSYGTYVINRQSPNKQIWLSSPISGPKRYDFVANRNIWYYKHDDQSLHELLQEEISRIIKNNVDFNLCSYSCPKRN